MVDLCQGTPWGFFTQCFQQLITLSVVALLMLIGGIYRLTQLSRANYKNLGPLGKVQKLKILLCSIVGISFLVSIGAKIVFIDDWLWFQVLGDVRDFITWSLCVVVIWREFQTGSSHSWVVRTWWVLEYIGFALLLQGIVFDVKDISELGYAYDVVMTSVRFAATTVLSVLGLWVAKGRSTGELQRLIGDGNTRGYNSSKLFQVEGTKNPYEKANVFSKLCFSWATSLVSLGNKKTLDLSDLWHLPEADTSENCATILEQNWEVQKRKTQPSLFNTIWIVHWRKILLSGFGKLLQDVGVLIGPVILYRFILYFEAPYSSIYEGLSLAVVLHASLIVRIIGANLNVFVSTRIGNQIQAALISMVYRKTTKINIATKNVGEIMNHQSVDANSIALALPQLHMIWSVPLQLVVVLSMLWYYIGITMLAGLVVVLIIIPVTFIATRKMRDYQKEINQFRDSRVRLVSEVLSGIRFVKLFNWEQYFCKRVNETREQEMHRLYMSFVTRLIISSIIADLPIFVSAAILTSYFLQGLMLTPEIAFTVLAIVNTINYSIGYLPLAVAALVEARLSLKRIQRFLLAEELDSIVSRDVSEDLSIHVTDANFKWQKDHPTVTLKDINLSVKRGELIAIVGSVGCGKSSFLLGLLGEIHKVSGEVRMETSVAYVSQQAWIQNATVRANILFGKAYDEILYRKCILCSELTQDLAMLPNGDNTEIGEKGINLSGGQKQRVALARAMYQNASVYLLDSPLSAVDAHVGSAIFDNMIIGALRDKTRILVTHQLNLLPRVDRIILMQNGSIVQVGTHKELMASGSSISDLILKLEQQNSNDKKEKADRKQQTISDFDSKPAGLDGEVDSGKIITEEERKRGAIVWQIYMRYFFAAGSILSLVIFLIEIAEASTMTLSSWWVSEWTSKATLSNTGYYLEVYLIWCLAAVTSTISFNIGLLNATMRAARKLHSDMVVRILHSPLSFFDTTPVGRLLNRLSKDTANIDAILPLNILITLAESAQMLAIIALISYVVPIFLVPLLPISYLFYFLQQYSLKSTREVQRLDAITKSPIYALFSETLSGVSTIRAFGVTQDFLYDNAKKIDKNSRALFAVNAVNRWFSFQMEICCSFVVLLSALICSLLKGNINSSLAALVILNALILTTSIFSLVRNTALLETNVVSVERVIEYSNLASEKPTCLERTSSLSPQWPSEGHIDFKGFSLRYRPGLDLVLSGLTLTINSCEKIGIVGRTGAGKSSVFLSLLRLIEADNGGIYIDNENIASIDLSTLRSKLAIIPQDPFLFTGTVRSNLDPENLYTDDEIWAALESVHVKDAITELPDGIYSTVVENGNNFSVGQRQLLCLGRALLRKTKILLMDEATASVDLQTDELIQQTIQATFKDMTVLTIAHRINTIMHSDKILVLDKGRVAEFDTPANLSSNVESLFYALLRESNINSSSG